MITLAEARAHVLAGAVPLAPVEVPLADALGCVLAEAIVATEAIPPFANTAMDGFAVQARDTAGASADTPAALRVVGTLPAGRAPDREVGVGEAIRIMTGAPMPAGADAVVMVELTRTDGPRRAADGDLADTAEMVETVEVLAAVEPGNHVRAAGDDLVPGQAVFEPGAVISAGHLGVLASLGRSSVRVVPPATVGVFSTGDELVPTGIPLQPGQIRDSNRIALLALVRQSGCVPVDLGLIPDDEQAITDAITAGVARCDAIVTTGGVSMGDYDFVKVVLDRIAEMRWMQVAIRPAKPLAFGTVAPPSDAGPDARRVPVFGLPGNPVSSMVSFELFARPALRRMMGHAADALDRPTVQAVVDDGIGRRPDGRTLFARVVARYDEADARHHVSSAGKQGSHHLSAAATANALAIVPDGDAIEPGATVRVMLLE
jgi:molybdenum cofactor synthesis domain-containing protein